MSIRRPNRKKGVWCWLIQDSARVATSGRDGCNTQTRFIRCQGQCAGACYADAGYIAMVALDAAWVSAINANHPGLKERVGLHGGDKVNCLSIRRPDRRF